MQLSPCTEHNRTTMVQVSHSLAAQSHYSHSAVSVLLNISPAAVTKAVTLAHVLIPKECRLHDPSTKLFLATGVVVSGGCCWWDALCARLGFGIHQGGAKLPEPRSCGVHASGHPRLRVDRVQGRHGASMGCTDALLPVRGCRHWHN